MRDYLLLEKMLNPPEKLNKATDVSTTNGKEITRFTINVESQVVDESTFPNTINSNFINTFDFPTMNEKYSATRTDTFMDGSLLIIGDRP